MKLSWDEIIELYNTGEPAKKETAAVAAIDNMRAYINGFSQKYLFGHAEKEDLEQVGYEVIIQNLGAYNPEVGSPTTFFTPFLRRAFLLEAVGKDKSMYYTCTNRKIKKAIEELSNNGIDTPSPEQLADVTGISESTIRTTLDMNKQCESIDTEENLSLISQFGNPETEAIKKEKQLKIADAIRGLNKPGKQLVYCIFTYENEHDKSPSDGRLCIMMKELFGKTYSQDAIRRLKRDTEDMLVASAQLKPYQKEVQFNKIKTSFPELNMIQEEEENILENNDIMELLSE